MKPSPPPYRISICGKYEIDRFAAEGVTHLLSIEDPGTPKSTPGWFLGPHHQIHLHDIDNESQALDEAGVLPQQVHVQAILEMGEKCLVSARAPGASGSVHLLVHCFAGISRSTAAAFILTVQSIGVERAREALEIVLAARPQANPNVRLVREADRLMKACGRLTSALEPARARFMAEIDAWLTRAGDPSAPEPDVAAPGQGGDGESSSPDESAQVKPAKKRKRPAKGRKPGGTASSARRRKS